MNPTSLSERIKMLRIKKGLDQKQLGKAINYRQQTISKWETGSSFPDAKALGTLSNFFKVKISDLVVTPIVLEESAHYGAPEELFNEFFSSLQFQEYYKLNDVDKEKLTQMVIHLCELMSNK